MDEQEKKPPVAGEAAPEPEQVIAQLRQELLRERRQAAEKEAMSGLRFSSKSAGEAFVTRLRAAELPVGEKGLDGVTDFIKSYRGEDPAAFVSGEVPRVVEATPGGAAPDRQKFSTMSYRDRVKLRQENPGLYRELAEL